MLRSLWERLKSTFRFQGTSRKDGGLKKRVDELQTGLDKIAYTLAIILTYLTRQSSDIHIDKVCIDKAILDKLIFDINDIGVRDLSGSLSIGINYGGKVIKITPPISDGKNLIKEDSKSPRALLHQGKKPLISDEHRWPPVNILETATEIMVRAEIPGFRQASDIQVELRGNTLRLAGESAYKSQLSQKVKVHKEEIYQGKFSRKIILPVPVQSTDAQTAYHQGILEIKLKKSSGNLQERLSIKFPK